MSEVNIDNVQLSQDGVQGIVVSPIQPDQNSTAFVRLVQIYTDPSTVQNRRPVITLKLYGGDQSINDMTPLEIATPTFDF
jgi:hypothetical protein